MPESDPSLGYAMSFGADVSTSIRGGKYRFWLRHTEEPFERDFTPWRHEAPWFQEKRCLALYAEDSGARPQWRDPADPELASAAAKLERALTTREAQARRSVGRRIDDPDAIRRLIELGYLPDELGIRVEEFERLRSSPGGR